MIEKRKEDHIQICLKNDVTSKTKTGFEEIHLINNPLTDVNLETVDLSIDFLDKRLNAPIAIDAITGGFSKAKKINEDLAKTAESFGFAFFLGSMRPIFEKKELIDSYKVREIAPTIPIIGNLGISQLNNYGVDEIESILEELDCDAIAIHLNAFQEIIQPEGQKDFSKNKEKLNDFCELTSFPVIVKETGNGIGFNEASTIFEMGAEYISTGGLGGTNWALVEKYRNPNLNINEQFYDFGIPTSISTYACASIGKTISSGGIRTGYDIAKSIALGAKMSALALPFLKAQDQNNLDKFSSNLIRELLISCAITGSKNIDELSKKETIKVGKTAEQIFYWNNIINNETSSNFLNEIGNDLKKEGMNFEDIFSGD